MKPIFTIHEGEFLAGDAITRKFGSRLDVWVPTRDSGVDLLVTPRKGGAGVRIQVKFSRSFPFIRELAGKVKATSWFILDPAKIRASRADLWLFVIITPKLRQHFVLIPTRELLKRAPLSGRWHLYLWVYPHRRCYNVRDLGKGQRVAAMTQGVSDGSRDFSKWLEKWSLLGNGGTTGGR